MSTPRKTNKTVPSSSTANAQVGLNIPYANNEQTTVIASELESVSNNTSPNTPQTNRRKPVYLTPNGLKKTNLSANQESLPIADLEDEKKLGAATPKKLPGSPSVSTPQSLFSRAKALTTYQSVNLTTTAQVTLTRDEAARAIAYNELTEALISTQAFKRQAELAATEKLYDVIKNIRKISTDIKVPKEGMKPAQAKIKVKYEQYLMEKLKALENKKKNDADILDKNMQKLGSGYKKLKDRYYADKDSARAVIPKVIQAMVQNVKVRAAAKELYETRNDWPNDPAMMIAVGAIPADEKNNKPEKNYCIISLSSSNTSLSFISALVDELKDKSFIHDKVEYHILISYKLSDNFQELINKVLKALDEEARKSLKQMATDICNEEKLNPQIKDTLETGLAACFDSKLSCVATHTKEAFKTCAERYFISDMAKGLLTAALEKTPAIQIKGMDCIEFTFYREGIFKKRGDATQNIPRSSGVIPIVMEPHLHNEFFKRQSDQADGSTNEQETYYLNTMVPCTACTINKCMVHTLFSGIVELMNNTAQAERLAEANQAIDSSPSTLTPSRSQRKFDAKRFVELTPQSPGAVIHTITDSDVAKQILSFEETDTLDGQQAGNAHTLQSISLTPQIK
jgi:hypothetical protein